MIICNDCNAVYDNDDLKIVEQSHPYGEGQAYEKLVVCPRCGSDDISEAEQCAICGGVFPSGELDVICKPCQETVRKQLAKYINDSFNLKTIEWLEDNWETIELVQDDEL